MQPIALSKHCSALPTVKSMAAGSPKDMHEKFKGLDGKKK